SERHLDARRTQHRAERNQVEIVHPHDVVAREQRFEAAYEHGVDVAIRTELRAVVLEKAEAVMEQRPQRVVAETVVVLLELPLVELERCIGHTASRRK